MSEYEPIRQLESAVTETQTVEQQPQADNQMVAKDKPYYEFMKDAIATSDHVRIIGHYYGRRIRAADSSLGRSGRIY